MEGLGVLLVGRKNLDMEQEKDGCVWGGKPCMPQERLQGKEGIVELLSTRRWSSVRIKGRLERAGMTILAKKAPSSVGRITKSPPLVAHSL